MFSQLVKGGSWPSDSDALCGSVSMSRPETVRLPNCGKNRSGRRRKANRRGWLAKPHRIVAPVPLDYFHDPRLPCGRVQPSFLPWLRKKSPLARRLGPGAWVARAGCFPPPRFIHRPASRTAAITKAIWAYGLTADQACARLPRAHMVDAVAPGAHWFSTNLEQWTGVEPVTARSLDWCSAIELPQLTPSA